MFLFENDPQWAAYLPSSLSKNETIVVNLSRRDFLKKTMLAAGSTFVLGLFNSCGEEVKPFQAEHKVPASGNYSESGFQPNVFIGLNASGDLFVVCPRSEMGQGIRSSMPVIIADEMGADWARVHVVQADGDPKYGDQNTDGSRSIRNHFDDWRTAGAAAREMLIAAAAQSWGVPAADCSANDHKVLHSASNREMAFGDLAAAAAELEVPEKPVLKPRDQWRYIGKATRGIDNRAITNGTAIFGIDATLPGMRHAVVARCPVIGGKVKKYDAAAALAVPGVWKVINLPAAALPATFQALGGLAVIADNTWAAIKGREALEIEWDFGDNHSFQSDGFRGTMEQNVKAPAKEIRTVGDVAKAEAEAATIVEADYYVPMLAHAPMEPPCALATVSSDGSCEIWAPTQDPQAARNTVAAFLGVPPEQVTVHVTLLGGGFGRKSKPDYIVEAALISRAVGTPIKVTWTREDEIQFDYFHAPAAQYLRAGLDGNGKTLSWVHRTAFPSISSTFAPGITHAGAGELGLGFTTVPYNIPNMRCENGEAPAHVRIGWLRSVCNIQHAFAVNAFSGELAKAAGRDQKDYLLELIGTPRHLNHLFEGEKGAYGEDLKRHPYDTGRLSGVINLVAEKAGWGRQLPSGEALGIAAHFSFVSYVAAVVHASVKENKVVVKRVDCAIDCGTYVNADRVIAQMEGAVVFGLSLALHGKITVKDGAVVQSNFHDYPLLRLAETPEIHVHIVNSELPPGGVGEPGVPPIAPALTNAILQITGKPVRELPVRLGQH